MQAFLRPAPCIASLACGLLAPLLGAVAPSSANPVLVGIDFFDSNTNGDGTGGPHWRGVVDTGANTLTISFWDELPDANPDFWIPNLSQGPKVWYAVDADNNPYDVPDSFGADGVVEIGRDWAFISPTSANDVEWLDGDFNSAAGFFPGWGGVRVQTGRDEFTNFVDTFDIGFDLVADETTLPLLPAGNPDPNTGMGFSVRSAIDATVTVTSIASATVSAVPEISPAVAFPVLVAGFYASRAVFAARRRRPRRRRTYG